MAHDLLQRILDHPEGFVDRSGQLVAQDLLRRFFAAGWLEEGPPWKLSQAGLNALLVGVKVHSPQRVFRRNEAPLDDLTTYEVFLELDHLGWSLKVVGSKQAKDLQKTPWVPGPGARLKWFAQKQCGVKHDYLLCLLKAHKELLRAPVPHFASAETYARLLGKEPQMRKSRKAKSNIIWGDQDWPEAPAQDEHEPRRRKRRRANIGEAAPRARSSSGTSSGSPLDPTSLPERARHQHAPHHPRVSPAALQHQARVVRIPATMGKCWRKSSMLRLTSKRLAPEAGGAKTGACSFSQGMVELEQQGPQVCNAHAQPQATTC